MLSHRDFRDKERDHGFALATLDVPKRPDHEWLHISRYARLQARQPSSERPLSAVHSRTRPLRSAFS